MLCIIYFSTAAIMEHGLIDIVKLPIQQVQWPWHLNVPSGTFSTAPTVALLALRLWGWSQLMWVFSSSVLVAQQSYTECSTRKLTRGSQDLSLPTGNSRDRFIIFHSQWLSFISGTSLAAETIACMVVSRTLARDPSFIASSIIASPYLLLTWPDI